MHWETLSRCVNIDSAQRIVDAGRTSIHPRDPACPPSEIGLLGIAGYTSCGLYRVFREAHEALADGRRKADLEAVMALRQMIIDTLGTLKPRPADVVRRCTVMDANRLELYRPGKLIQIQRLTSVTFQKHQVYTGGNADMIFYPRHGVVDVSPLSDYSHGARGEIEGLLEPGRVFEVVRQSAGKESGQPSSYEAVFPAVTIVLRER